MKAFIGFVALAIAAAPALLAGEIHGTVTCQGAQDNSNAVVYVDSIAGKTFPAPSKHAVMNQENMAFSPHVLPVVVRTTVDFLNHDNVLHNVFTPSACAGHFNLGTWAKGQRRSYTFKEPCFATLLCMIHPEMEGYVAAVPTPYFAVTSGNGSYTIKNVPDGSYTLKVWHPTLKAAQKPVTVKGSTEVNFTLAQ
ncbi:MAG TPA: carboxypeptidase regulatory-like domain-containing protein [Thermoanaerobaculia bacterium]|nr:carboxypeptidase regulatory-like domain-containing protein [Thermoanaerobaculia bacterium]